MASVGIFEFWNVAPHLQTGLEIGLDKALNGEDVFFFHWGRYLGYNEKKGYTNHPSPGSHLLPERKLATLCAGLIKDCSDEFLDSSSELQLPNVLFANQYLLKRLVIHDYPVGALIWANLCDIAKCSMPDMEKYRHLINAMIQTFDQVYQNTQAAIQRYSISNIILFNGRFISSSAVQCAAMRCGVQMGFHERGYDSSRYIFMDKPVHNISAFQALLKNAWFQKSISDDEALLHGHQLLKSRLRRQDPETQRYAFNQRLGSLGDLRISSSLLNIVFFCSSDDEFRWLINSNDIPMGPWNDQRAAIFDLFQIASRLEHKAKIYVVVHPNTLSKSDDEQHLWEIACLPSNCVLVHPSMDVCSYSLLQACDLVISFGSTIGVEALALRKPSLLMAPATYDYLPSIKMVQNVSWLEQFIRQMMSSQPIDTAHYINDASMHFYSLYNCGCKHKFYVKSHGATHFTFLGLTA